MPILHFPRLSIMGEDINSLVHFENEGMTIVWSWLAGSIPDVLLKPSAEEGDESRQSQKPLNSCEQSTWEQ